MRKMITLLVLIISGSLAWAQPSFVVTVDTFDEQLSPYGSWFDLPGYGRVWQPGLEYVGEDFYPYGTDGRWVFTEEGWIFDSELPFGWAVFHYGRWVLDPDYGWLWTPGRTWAPAWVSWRMGGDYVGWAPMGPRGAPEVHRSAWLFVETRELTVVNVRSRAIDEGRFRGAVTITSPVHGAVPIGPPAAYVTRASRGVQISPVRVNDLRGSGRAIPPPPPQVAPRPSRNRLERERTNPAFNPPPPQQQQRERTNPAFNPPPPQPMEQRGAPPPQRLEQRAPPPRAEQQTPVFRPAPPAPGQPQQQQSPPPRQRNQQGPPPAPGRRGGNR